MDGEGQAGRVVEAADRAGDAGSVEELGLVAQEADSQVTEGCSSPAAAAHGD